MRSLSRSPSANGFGMTSGVGWTRASVVRGIFTLGSSREFHKHGLGARGEPWLIQYGAALQRVVAPTLRKARRGAAGGSVSIPRKLVGARGFRFYGAKLEVFGQLVFQFRLCGNLLLPSGIDLSACAARATHQRADGSSVATA